MTFIYLWILFDKWYRFPKEWPMKQILTWYNFSANGLFNTLQSQELGTSLVAWRASYISTISILLPTKSRTMPKFEPLERGRTMPSKRNLLSNAAFLRIESHWPSRTTGSQPSSRSLIRQEVSLWRRCWSFSNHPRLTECLPFSDIESVHSLAIFLPIDSWPGHITETRKTKHVEHTWKYFISIIKPHCLAWT